MRYEVEPIEFSLRLYAEHEDNYVASCLIRVYGDRGFLSMTSSPLIYGAIPQFFNDLLDKLGLKTLEGYTSKAMARALRIKSRSWAKFDITHYGICAGREMPWIVLSRKE